MAVFEMEDAASVEFSLLEGSGIQGRLIDDITWDTGYHGFECMFATLSACGVTTDFEIESVHSARYIPDVGEAEPSNFTFSKIQGHLHNGLYRIPFTIKVGKKMGAIQKQLIFRDMNGAVLYRVDLNESGPDAHYRILKRLLTEPKPDVKVGINETIKVIEACRTAHAMAIDEGFYLPGATPIKETQKPQIPAKVSI